LFAQRSSWCAIVLCRSHRRRANPGAIRPRWRRSAGNTRLRQRRQGCRPISCSSNAWLSGIAGSRPAQHTISVNRLGRWLSGRALDLLLAARLGHGPDCKLPGMKRAGSGRPAARRPEPCALSLLGLGGPRGRRLDVDEAALVVEP